MKLTVFGATGGTGQQLVSQALAAGCAVTALVRHPALGKSQSGLTFLSGDTHDSEAVGRAVAGNDAVLCALGGRPWRRSENVCSSAMPNIIDAMHKHSVRRIIAISTFGAGDSRPQAPWLARALIFGFILRTEVADKEAMEAQLSSSGVDWTVVRVGVLAGEASRGVYRAKDDQSIRGMGKISRADVASFMLSELQSNTWLRRCPVLMY